MRAVSPGRVAVHDMDTDYGRLYGAMAEKFLDRADIIALSSGCVADIWPLWVSKRHSAMLLATSAPKGEADEIRAKAEVAPQRLAIWPSKSEIPSRLSIPGSNKTPPSDASRPPSNRAHNSLPATGDKPGR